MVRSWIRQALRASGVAILVPAAVVAAIALSALGGGGDVASLGEVLRGPAVPPAEAAQPPAIPRPAPRPSATPRVVRAPRRTRPAPLAPPRRHAGAPAPPVRTLPVGRPHPLPRRPAPAQPPAAPAPVPAAPAPPPARPHPVHDLGTQAAGTLRPLPLAGPVAADAVQAVVDLVDPA